MSKMRRTWVLWGLIGFTLLYTIALPIWFASVPGDGYAVAATAERFKVTQDTEGGPLSPGDTLIAIAGQPFDGNLLQPGFWHQRLFGPDGCADSTCSYTIRRSGQEMTVQIELRHAALADLLRGPGIYLFIGLSFVMPALFLALRRHDDRVGYLMALALTCAGLSIINNSINAFSANLSVALFWLSLPIDLLTFWFTFSLPLHVFLIFPQETGWFKRHPWLAYPLHAFSPVVCLIGALILRGDPKLVSLQSSIYSLAYPIAVSQLLASIALIVHTYRIAHTPLVRNQIRWIGWGVALGTSGWLLLFALPRILVGIPLVDLSVALLPLFVVPIGLTFAVYRYRLLDIDSLINQSLVYGASSLFLIVFYLIDVALISRGIQLLTGRADDSIVILISTLLVAFAFAPARTHFQRLIDRTLYKSKLAFERLFHQIAQELSTTIVVDDLMVLLTRGIPQRLKVAGAVLYILDPEEKHFVPYGWPEAQVLPRHQVMEHGLDQVWLAESGQSPPKESWLSQAMPGICLCLPLSSHQRLIGLYGLGAKRSGDVYTGQEINILTASSHQVAISLENARLYRQVETYSKTLEELASQRTQQLELANEALHSEKNKLDAVLNTIADGLIVTDVSGRINRVNPVAEQILGQPSSALMGRPLGALVGNGVLMSTVIAALEKPGQVLTVDFAWGERILKSSSCALHTTHVAGGEADVTGVVTILRDVTHEVEVDRMKTEFISTVSHELRTPLTSVLGFAKLIRRTFDRTIVPLLPTQDPQVQRATHRVIENLQVIQAESQRLTGLINDLLDIAKIESGKIEWHQEIVSLKDVVKRAVSSASMLAAEAKTDLPLLVDIPPSLLPLCGDADRLVQVMTNLLSNAIKFTDEGQITIRARQTQNLTRPPEKRSTYSPSNWDRLAFHDPDDHWLVVSVTDTGIGIPSNDLPRVFEKFQQTGDALIDRPWGTGLGLTICKEIIEHHGGVIWVESQPGRGSNFSFALPVYNIEGIKTQEPALIETHPIVPARPLAEIRQRVSQALPSRPPDEGAECPLILVVDDDANVRELLRQELTEAGYRVIEAADGVEALAQARSQEPNLIVLDVMMPGVSGFDVTSVLKADQRTADTPILILSIVEDRERGLRLGADGYLTKPIDTDQLLQAIAVLLNSDPAERGRKVLVADQDVSVVEVITQALRQRGFEVVEAHGSRDAIRKARQERPDLVILDAMLGTVNDYEVWKALRYQDPHQKTNIIVMATDKVD